MEEVRIPQSKGKILALIVAGSGTFGLALITSRSEGGYRDPSP